MTRKNVNKVSVFSGRVQSASATTLILVLCAVGYLLTPAICQTIEQSFIEVTSPKLIPTDKIPCERIPLGNPGDYKPCITQLPSGEIILGAFQQAPKDSSKDMFFYRSKDGGKTWSDREYPGLPGREPYFSVLKDGTLFITVHHADSPDYIYSYLFRSTDCGKTWTTMKIGAEDVPGVPPKSWTHTSRNVLELKDGTLILGVSAGSSIDYLWRSEDKGKTWDKSLACKVHGFDVVKQDFPWYAETVFWQARNGDILAIARCFSGALPPIAGTEVATGDDQVERIALFRSRDGGANWSLEPELGSYYGEMYQAVQRLQNKKLLFTFTVRALRPPLGVKAVLGEEAPDGFKFDFTHDRIAIDSKTPLGDKSGGGFGPTIQLRDGTLVTSYSYRGPDERTHVEVARWKLPKLKRR